MTPARVLDAKYGYLDMVAEPNNIDEFEPHGDPDDMTGEHGSWLWHEITEDSVTVNPYEGMARCGICHPELLPEGWTP